MMQIWKQRLLLSFPEISRSILSLLADSNGQPDQCACVVFSCQNALIPVSLTIFQVHFTKTLPKSNHTMFLFLSHLSEYSMNLHSGCVNINSGSTKGYRKSPTSVTFLSKGLVDIFISLLLFNSNTKKPSLPLSLHNYFQIIPTTKES